MSDRHLLISTSTVPPGGFRYIQPETGRLLSAPNWQQLRSNVAEHRRANNLPIGTDFDAEIQDWICKHIPDASMHCHQRGQPAVRTYAPAGAMVGTGYQGQEKWRELHVYALTQRPQPMQRAAWLANFADSLPCGECRVSWKRLTRQKPLAQNATDEEFFRWTVDRHNDVNHKLGKRNFTYEEARALHQ